MTNVCSKKKKSARMGRETAKRILCVCVLSLDFVLPLFNCLQFFFFFSDRLCQYRNVSADKHAPLRSCSHFRT